MLKGKNAVITGCNRGIGKAVLKIFAQNGANVIACVRKEDEAFRQYIEQLMRQYGVQIIPVYFDLADQQQIKEAAAVIMKLKLPIDILVNNAGGLSPNQLFQMTPPEEMKKLFDVNFWGQILFTQYISRNMIRAKQGSIVFMSSVTALDGEPAQFEYVTSKAALVGATRNLAKAFGKFGIRVNAVAPGLIDTDMAGKMEEDLAEEMIRSTSLNRLGTPQEIAGAVLFLSADLSGYITGQVLRVDGGM